MKYDSWRALCEYIVFFGLISFGIYLGLGERRKQTTPTLESLLDAIAQVESQNNPDAVGDGGNAIGAYQIWKIYVDDVNRILGEKHFTYMDRFDAGKSRRMVQIYLGHYATEKRLGHKPAFEDMARIHNGGPNGYRKKPTIEYWKKVKGIMK